jgi:hypothetical protein
MHQLIPRFILERYFAGEFSGSLDAYRIFSLALLRQGKLDQAMHQTEDGLQLARRLGRRLEEGKF